MPSVFTDEAGAYDLTITTAADWTVSSGGLPNGDNYVTGDGSIDPTYNINGEDFEFIDGTAWTVEFWFYYTTATSLAQMIVCNHKPGASTGTDIEWQVYLETTEVLTFDIYNTAGGAYLSCGYAPPTSAWQHIVCIKETGDVVKMWANNVLVASDTSATGTANDRSDTRIYVGANGSGNADITTSSSGMRIAKLAIYNSQLSASQINDHYLAMVAT
jgi:hypothetical protein